jgi:hypothetical protein
MERFKIVALSVLGLVGALVFVFLMGLYGLGWQKFFLPKQENIRREVFEQTQSYTHGKIQDLAKYYEEYNKAENPNDREAIRSLIIMRFAEFDRSKIRSGELRRFLTNTRGY